MPSALAVASTGAPASRVAAVVAPNTPQIAVGWKPRSWKAPGVVIPTRVTISFPATIAVSISRPVEPRASADATASALGIAGSFAGGLFAYLDDATPTKPMHPAWAAHGGILASRLASLGAEGPPGVLEGRFGVYHAFVGATKGEVDIDAQLADLGARWETLRIA